MGPEFQLHHVGYAVQEIAPAAALYVARFGYVVKTPAIHDPKQTALVQFLQLPGESFCLELVAPDGEGSRLSAAVARGGGLHHLCYAVDSLEASIAHLEGLESKSMRLILEPAPAVAFAGRRICWMLGGDRGLVELVERSSAGDVCVPGKEHVAPGEERYGS